MYRYKIDPQNLLDCIDKLKKDYELTPEQVAYFMEVWGKAKNTVVLRRTLDEEFNITGWTNVD